MSETQLRKLIEQQFARKQDVLRAAPGVLGDGQGNVNAGGGLVYARMVDQVFTVLNRRAPLINELPVWIGEDPLQPGTIQVLSARETGLARGSSSAPLIVSHGDSHRYPNPDTTWIELEQFMPFRLIVSGLGLILYSRPVWNGTEYVDVPVTDPDAPINMAAHIPVVSGKAAWVLITISTTGAVVETKGSEVDLADLVLADIPTAPSGTAYTLAAVRVYCGQERIVRSREGSDILDLRFPMRHTHAAADLTSGIISPDRFSAYDDLVIEEKIGTGETQVAAGNHTHPGNNLEIVNEDIAEAANGRAWILETVTMDTSPVGILMAITQSKVTDRTYQFRVQTQNGIVGCSLT